MVEKSLTKAIWLSFRVIRCLKLIFKQSLNFRQCLESLVISASKLSFYFMFHFLNSIMALKICRNWPCLVVPDRKFNAKALLGCQNISLILRKIIFVFLLPCMWVTRDLKYYKWSAQKFHFSLVDFGNISELNGYGSIFQVTIRITLRYYFFEFFEFIMSSLNLY